MSCFTVRVCNADDEVAAVVGTVVEPNWFDCCDMCGTDVGESNLVCNSECRGHCEHCLLIDAEMDRELASDDWSKVEIENHLITETVEVQS